MITRKPTAFLLSEDELKNKPICEFLHDDLILLRENLLKSFFWPDHSCKPFDVNSNRYMNLETNSSSYNGYDLIHLNEIDWIILKHLIMMILEV